MRCKNLLDLIGFITVVFLCAPDKFPKEDFLEPGEQLNLPRAFEKMRDCLDRRADDLGAVLIAQAHRLADGALLSYEDGKLNEGAWKLQELVQLLESAARKGTQP